MTTREQELTEALREALDFIEGLLLGARMLRGERGTLKSKPSPEMQKLRAVLEKETN